MLTSWSTMSGRSPPMPERHEVDRQEHCMIPGVSELRVSLVDEVVDEAATNPASSIDATRNSGAD
jgi:hypothetical protein